MYVVVRGLKKEDFLYNLHVLPCIAQLKSVLLISCVFWVSSKMIQMTVVATHYERKQEETLLPSWRL